jgi:lysophospholipase L1-like esterase
MADYQLHVFSPSDVFNPPDGVIRKWDGFPTRFLVQGDSWFSFGALPPWGTSNILQQITLGFDASAINCANPGRRLARMVDWKLDRNFLQLLAGKLACKWDGILLSGGGNDLIAAAAVLPVQAGGVPVPPDQRLLLKPEEWLPPEHGAARYLSDAGWATFAAHLAPQFDAVLAQRDADINRNVPLFCHSYAYPTPRDAPASAMLHVGPWLYPSVMAYGIPQADWLGVGTALIDRLATLLRQIVAGLNGNGDRRVYLVETQQTLIPAQPGTTGPSNDWENEIHPTPGGYRKLAALWRPVVEAQMS